jgi:uncharacterized protein
VTNGAVDTSADRLVVPDVLRGIAILAMLIAHAKRLLPEMSGSASFVTGNISDLASPLFALVFGLSAQILLQRTPRTSRALMLVQQGIRGVVLIALGLWLTTWGTWVDIILSYLGVVLILGVPLLFLSTRWVVVIAVAVAAVSDPVNGWAREALWPVIAGGASPVVAYTSYWVFLGDSYRVTNLLPFFLLGALLMRHGFTRDRALWIMAGVAPLAYVVRPVLERVTRSPEAVSGSIPDTLHDVGLVFATYVVIVLLATVRQPRPARAIAIVFEPLRAIGATALSIYLFHIGLLALMTRWGYVPIWDGYAQWAAIVVGVTAIGWVWWRFIGVGPVEWLLGWVTLRPKRWRRDRANSAVEGAPTGL